jgi:hypothetical protein
MGFFKKIFKGIKKVFKKIGKGIKSAFKKVGKFMGKIGIVGQLGLALIMPYALPALGGLATGMMGTQLGGALGAVVKGAGHFLNAAVKVGTRVGTAFKSVTSAVTDTIGNMVGATINSLPGGQQFGTFMKDLTAGKIDITELNFDTAWSKTQDAWRTAGSDLGQLFSKSTIDSSMNKFGIQANLQESVGKTFSPDAVEIAGPTQDGSLLQAEALGPQQITYDPVTGQRSFVSQGLDITDPDNFSLTERMGLGTPDKMYSATGNLPLGLDEGVFTVEGVRPTFQAPSLMSPPAPTASGPVAFETMQLDPSNVGVSMESTTQNIIDSGGYQAPKLDTSMVLDTTTKSLGTKARDALAGKGIELTKAGGLSLAQEYVDAKSLAQQQQDYYDSLQNSSQPFIDYSAMQTSPIQSSPGLSTSNLTPMAGFDYFAQIQDDILNSNYSNIYAQGYYGSAGLQAGLAQAYEELAA